MMNVDKSKISLPKKWDNSIIDVFKKVEISCKIAESSVCDLICEDLKKEEPTPFFTTNAPGAIGLRRDLDTGSYGSDGKLLGHISNETTRNIRIKKLRIDDIKEIVNYQGPKSEIQDREFMQRLWFLLRELDLLQSNVSVDIIKDVKLSHLEDPFTCAIHGKLGKKADIRTFFFHAEKWIKIDCNIMGSAELAVAINTIDETAFVRLKPTVTDLIRHVNEVFVVFNARPKLTMHMALHMKTIKSKNSGETYDIFKSKLQEIVTLDSATQLILNTPEIISEKMKPDPVNHDRTMFFLNETFPLVRYIQRTKGGKHSEIGHLPYDSYVPYFTRYVHDLAKLQYTYAILSAVAAALWRETDKNDPNVSWDDLVSYMQKYAEETGAKDNHEIKHEKKWSFKVEISVMAALVSSLYTTTTKFSNNEKAQLQRLFSANSGLEEAENSRAPSEFGHLLAVYAYESAPLHVVIAKEKHRKDDPNTLIQSDVKHTKTELNVKGKNFQKLTIFKLNLGDDNGKQNHSRRWSVNLVSGSEKRAYFPLKKIMTATETNYTNYWQKKFNIQNEAPDWCKNELPENKFLIPINFSSSFEFNLRLDDYYTNILGVEIKDGRKLQRR